MKALCRYVLFKEGMYMRATCSDAGGLNFSNLRKRALKDMDIVAKPNE